MPGRNMVQTVSENRKLLYDIKKPKLLPKYVKYKKKRLISRSRKENEEIHFYEAKELRRRHEVDLQMRMDVFSVCWSFHDLEKTIITGHILKTLLVNIAVCNIAVNKTKKK